MDPAGPTAEPLAARRAALAAAARRRRGWLRQPTDPEATLAGLVLDVAERGEVVAVELVGGWRLVGRAWSVSPSVAALRLDGGDDVLVALGAVATVRAAGDGAGAPTGAREVAAAGDGSMAEALATLADERPVVAVRAGDGRSLAAGVLVGAGRDVCTVAADGGTVHVAVGAVATVGWRAG